MVKLKGPLLSTKASGQLAKTLTFSTTKRGPTLRRSPRPGQPRTPLQISFRAMLSFLCRQWRNLTTVQQSSWDLAFPNTTLNRYAAYTKYNLERWHTFKPPTKSFPPQPQLDPPPGVTCHSTGGTRHILHDTTVQEALNDAWGSLVLRERDIEQDPAPNWMIHVFHHYDLLKHTWTESPLEPGPYTTLYFPFSNHGRFFENLFTSDAATVT